MAGCRNTRPRPTQSGGVFSCFEVGNGMSDELRLMGLTTKQLLAEMKSCIQDCRLLKRKIDKWEARLSGLTKFSNDGTVIDKAVFSAIRDCVKHYKQRLDTASSQINLCRKILNNRQHDIAGAQS